MFTFINSLSFASFALLNIAVILGCIYFIRKERGKNKLYVPLLYLVSIGSLILILNKYVSDNLSFTEFASVTKLLVYGYLGVFLITLICLSIIGLKRTNDPNINKPMICAGLFLIVLCICGYALIYMFSN